MENGKREKATNQGYQQAIIRILDWLFRQNVCAGYLIHLLKTRLEIGWMSKVASTRASMKWMDEHMEIWVNMSIRRKHGMSIWLIEN